MASQNRPIKSHRSRNARSQHQVECFEKWLWLRGLKEYRDASQQIHHLREQQRKAEERLSAAYDAYLPLLPYPIPSVPDSPDKQRTRQEYWESEESAKKAQECLTRKEDETCKKFGL